jgi:hypothetical protein
VLRTLVKDSAVYAVGTIASRLVGFIMIPVYTRVLTPADYGIYSVSSVNSSASGLNVAIDHPAAGSRGQPPAKPPLGVDSLRQRVSFPVARDFQSLGQSQNVKKQA